jgi:hypothetical protein
MKNLAPDILRQRLLIEGYYQKDVTKETIHTYFLSVAAHLNLRTYGEPIIFSPEGMGQEGNQGFDAFIPLIDSGISGYFWATQKFLSIIIYTCKSFDESEALTFTKSFFEVKEAEVLPF